MTVRPGRHPDLPAVSTRGGHRCDPRPETRPGTCEAAHAGSGCASPPARAARVRAFRGCDARSARALRASRSAPRRATRTAFPVERTPCSRSISSTSPVTQRAPRSSVSWRSSTSASARATCLQPGRESRGTDRAQAEQQACCRSPLSSARAVPPWRRVIHRRVFRRLGTEAKLSMEREPHLERSSRPRRGVPVMQSPSPAWAITRPAISPRRASALPWR